jgi:hypothetical protein
MFGSHADLADSGAPLNVLPFSGLGHCTAQAAVLAGKLRFTPLGIRASKPPAAGVHAVPTGYRLHLYLGREVRGR